MDNPFFIMTTIYGCPVKIGPEVDWSIYCDGPQFKFIRDRLFRSQYLNHGSEPMTFVRDLELVQLVMFQGLDASNPLGALDLTQYLSGVDPRCSGLWTKVEHAAIDFLFPYKNKRSKKSKNKSKHLAITYRSKRKPLLVVINDP